MRMSAAHIIAIATTLADINSDGKTDWRDESSIFTLLLDRKGPTHDPAIN